MPAFKFSGMDDLAGDIHRMRVNTTQLRPALKEIAEILATGQRRQFATEGGHYGTPWKKLDPDTVRAKGHSRILENTGRLRRSVAPANAAGFGVLKVTNDSVEIGTTVPYAAHVHATRPIVGEPPAADQKAIADALHRHIMKGTRHARS